VEGFSPQLNNDADLWILVRDRVSRAGPRAVILVGSSRIQIGIDPDSFARATGWDRPLQLAIPRGPARVVLRDLSLDPDVSGRVICDVNPVLFFDATHQMDFVPAHYIRRRSEFTPADVIEAHLRTFTQRTLVSSLPALFPRQLLRSLRTRSWPRPSHVVFDIERFGRADFERFEGLAIQMQLNEASWTQWRGRPADPAALSAMIEQVDGMIRSIRARGGDVVFVRMPTDGAVRRREQRLFPRSEFWDVFAAKTDAVTIHFEDHPALSRFHPPDGSHLDQRDLPAFSTALGEIVVRELERRARRTPPGLRAAPRA